MRHAEHLGGLLRELERKGPVELRQGTTVSDPVGGRITVEHAGDRFPVVIPGSFRGNLAAGQQVTYTTKGSTRTIVSILTALPAPTVAAPPASSTITPWTMTDALGFTAAGFSNAGFTSQDFQCALYAEYVKDELNDCVDVVNNHQADITSLKNTVNSLRQTVADLKAALAAQGHVT